MINPDVRALLSHLAKRPSPPQHTVTKAVFQRFTSEYSKWLIDMDKLRITALKSAVMEISRADSETV